MKEEKEEHITCDGCIHLCSYPDGTIKCDYPMSVEKICLESIDRIYKKGEK